MPRLRADPVRGALLEARRRQRIDVQQGQTVRTDAIGGDDVVRERPAGERVVNRAYPAEKWIRRIQQLAEVAAPHSRRRHGRRRGQRVAAPDPFLAPEEEQLAAVGVESAGHQHRAAQVEAPLIETERVRAVRQLWNAASIALPTVRVERRVAVVLEGVSMEALRAALGDEPDLARR